MRLVLTLIIVSILTQPVLANQKEERTARAWQKRNEKKTLRQIVPRDVLACMEEDMYGSVPVSPDAKLGEIPEEMILEIHRIYLECRKEIAKKRSPRPKQKYIPPPQNHPPKHPPYQTSPPDEDARGFAGVFFFF